MKKLLGKVDKDFILESLGFSLVTFSLAHFGVAFACIFVGSFLIWLVESAN